MPNQQAFHYRNRPPKPKGGDVIAAKLGLYVKEDPPSQQTFIRS